MAERRAITARDVKSNVEGYSEMSDEAFARRFYSDRAELLALGVPLQSQRDEFTGEELYTLRSEQYFLPQLELENDELAALNTALYLLEGKFAYAEPLRLALQNLALGRPGFAEAPSATADRVEVLDPDYSPEMPGRLAKLEGAISKQRTVKFDYWSISRDETSERTLNPYALMPDNGLWYVVGHDLERDDIRTFRVSRIRGEIRFATRREGVAGPGGGGPPSAPARPGCPRAVRRPPGPARLPARSMRRGQGSVVPRRRAARALPVDPAGGARGAPLAAQPRQLRRRLLHGLRGAPRQPRACRQGALGRHVPPAAAP